MRKVIAVIGVIIGGLVIITMISFVALLVFLNQYTFGIIPGIALMIVLLIGVIVLLEIVWRKLKQKLFMKKLLYLVCVGIPPLISSIAALYIVHKLFSIGYWKQMFGGVAEYILSWAGICCSVFILIGMLLVTIIFKERDSC